MTPPSDPTPLPWRCDCTDECNRDGLPDVPVNIGVHGRGYLIILGGLLTAAALIAVGSILVGWAITEVAKR